MAAILDNPSDGEPDNEVATFLDGLLEAGLENVVHHLSSRPARADWVTFVALPNAMSALHRSSPLADVARRVFTRLAISGQQKVKGHVLMPDAFARLLIKWMKATGGSLESLRLDYSLTFPVVEDFLSPTRLEHLNCLSLCKLDLSRISKARFCTGTLLFSLRGRLCEQSAHGQLGWQKAEHCNGLR